MRSKKRKRQIRSFDPVKCTCGRMIPAGEWYWQHFDETGLFFKTTCKWCWHESRKDQS